MLTRTEDRDVLAFGIKLGELIGLFAFVLAITANVWLLVDYLSGAEVTMYPPEQVGLRCSSTEMRDITDDKGNLTKKRFCKEKSSVTVIASALAYTNEGGSGYHAVVKSETVDVKITEIDGSTRTMKLYWQWFTDISNVGISKTFAAPSLVKGGEAIAHETQFTSRYYSGVPEDKMLWNDFVSSIQARKVKIIRLKFSADLLGDKGPFEVECSLHVNARVEHIFEDLGMRRFQHTFSCET